MSADKNLNSAKRQLPNFNKNTTEIISREDSNLFHFDEAEFDIFYMKMPKTLDPEYLKGEKISLSGKTKIKINNEVYTFQPSTGDPQLVWLYSNGISYVQPVKYIMMEKSMKTKKRKLQNGEHVDIPLPLNVMPRNPFFGAQYKQKIKLDSTVQHKIDKAVENLRKQEMRFRKKKSMKTKINKFVLPEESTNQEEIFKILESHRFESKKKPKSPNLNKQIRDSTCKKYVSLKESSVSGVVSSRKRSKENYSSCDDTDSGIVDVKREFTANSRL